MVRKILICAFFVLGTLGIASAANIDGKWKGKMSSPQGDMELILSVKVVNTDSLTGVVQATMGELPMLNGKVKGDTFSFDIEFNGMTMHHQCSVQGDVLTIKMPGMNSEEMALVFTRVKEEKANVVN